MCVGFHAELKIRLVIIVLLYIQEKRNNINDKPRPFKCYARIDCWAGRRGKGEETAQMQQLRNTGITHSNKAALAVLKTRVSARACIPLCRALDNT